MTNEEFIRAKEIIQFIEHIEKMIEAFNRRFGFFNEQYNPQNGNWERTEIKDLPEELILPIKNQILKYYNEELEFWNNELKKL